MTDKSFEKNDKSLKIVKTIVQVTDIIFAALSIILGIICCYSGDAEGIATGLVYIIAVPLAIGLLYLIKDLIFSLMTDIKFIRNMLYDNVSMNVNTNRLKACEKESFISGSENNSSFGTDADKIRKLKELLDMNAISKSEYEVMKGRIISSANESDCSSKENSFENENKEKNQTGNIVKEDTTAKDIVKQETVKDKNTVKKVQTIYDIIKQVAEEETNVKEDIIANDTLKQNTEGAEYKTNKDDTHGFGELFRNH